MLKPGDGRSAVNEETIKLIAKRVIAALRDDLEVIAVELSARERPTKQLTVGQVARQMGVARSTVYAHWREWGGYKLGRGDKAPIRFDGAALPIVRRNPALRPSLTVEPAQRSAGKRRGRRDLLVDAPRLAQAPDEIAW